jgi:hypothetical protein
MAETTALTKKRLLLWDWTNTANNPQALNSLKFDGPIGYLSNWNTWTPPELQSRLPFQPTIRTSAQLTNEDWQHVQNCQEKILIIHFLNEPERTGLSATEAATLWKDKMVPFRQARGAKIVGPACASDEAGSNWLHEFMSLTSSSPPDFLGLHYYGTVAKDARAYLEGMHEKYPGLPVVVSEIASISRDKNEVRSFTVDMVNWMDQTEWIAEYGFFGCMKVMPDTFVSEEARLMDENGAFTELMVKLMTEQPMKS